MKRTTRFRRVAGAIMLSLSFVAPAANCKSWGYFWAPVINAVEPAFGAVGDEVTISGAQFSSVPAQNTVHFGATQADVVSSSETLLKVKVPRGAASGKIKVTVREGPGESPSDFRVEKYVVYLVNNAGTIFGSASDNLTGAMTTVASVAAGTTNDVAVDSKGRFLYVTIGFDNGIRGYAIGASGQLSQMTTSPFAPTAGGTESTKIGIDALDKAVYYFDVSSPAYFRSLIDAAGSLPNLVNQSLFHSIQGFVSDPAAHFLYASGTAGVHAYNIDSATRNLSNMAGSPFNTTNQISDIQFDAAGKYLFGGRTIPTSIVRFTLDSASGQLSDYNTFSAPDGVNSLAVHPTGKFVYAVDNGGANIQAFPVDAAGNLGTASATAAGGILVHVRVTPNGRYLMAANTAAALYVYAIGQDGSLTSVAGSPFTGLSNPNSMRIARVMQ